MSKAYSFPPAIPDTSISHSFVNGVCIQTHPRRYYSIDGRTFFTKDGRLYEELRREGGIRFFTELEEVKNER